MARNKIGGIILDVGGTLVYTIDAILEGMGKAFEMNGVPVPPPSEFIKSLGKGNVEIILGALPAEIGRDMVMYEKISRSFEQVFPSRVMEKLRGIEGVRPTLERLREEGYRLAITTAFNANEARAIMSRVDWDDSFFDAILTFDDVKEMRPSPEIVNLAVVRLGKQPGECVCVGDTVNDVLAARAAGAYVVSVLTGPQREDVLRSAKPDAVIPDVTHLPEILHDFPPEKELRPATLR